MPGLTLFYSNTRCDSLPLQRPTNATSTLIKVMFAALIPYILIYILLIPYDALYRGLIPPTFTLVLFGLATVGIVVFFQDYQVEPFQSFCITVWVIRLAVHELI